MTCERHDFGDLWSRKLVPLLEQHPCDMMLYTPVVMPVSSWRLKAKSMVKNETTANSNEVLGRRRQVCTAQGSVMYSFAAENSLQDVGLAPR